MTVDNDVFIKLGKNKDKDFPRVLSGTYGRKEHTYDHE